MAKWIEFKKSPHRNGFKTDLYHVVNKESRGEIGLIKWYGPFRKYSFFPDMHTVYEQDCMQDITDFLKQLTNERNKSKATRGSGDHKADGG